MIYFRNTPTAMDDLDTIEGRLRSTLAQLENHKAHLLSQIGDTIDGGIGHFEQKVRMLKSTNGLNMVNSLGEFQTNEMQRADILIQQAALTEEVIVQIKYVLDPSTQPQKKVSNAQQPATQRVRKAAQPRKEVGKRAAKRTGKPQGR